MSRRKNLAAIVAAALIGVFAAGVGIAGAEPLMSVEPNPVEAGSTVTISGSECSLTPEDAGSVIPGQVSVVIAGALVGQTTAGVDGSWSVEVPAPAEAGSYPVAATCDLYQGTFGYPAQDLQVTATIPEPVPPTATIGEVTRQGCLVSVPVTTTGAGPFTLTVWDDGDVVDDMLWNPGAGPATTVLNWVISAPAGEESPGIGLFVTVTVDGQQVELAVLDPWEYPATTAETCGEAGEMLIELVDFPGSVTPGGVVSVEASGFWPGEQVTVELHSEPVQLATLTADANGTVTGSLEIPPSTPPGSHTLVLTGVLSLLSTQIGVVVASESVPASPLPAATVTATATVSATAPATVTATATATARATATASATATATGTGTAAATATATAEVTPPSIGTATVGGSVSKSSWTGAAPDVAVAATSNGPALASTGTNAAGPSFVGLGLLLAGGALLAFGRRPSSGGHR